MNDAKEYMAKQRTMADYKKSLDLQRGVKSTQALVGMSPEEVRINKESSQLVPGILAIQSVGSKAVRKYHKSESVSPRQAHLKMLIGTPRKEIDK